MIFYNFSKILYALDYEDHLLYTLMSHIPTYCRAAVGQAFAMFFVTFKKRLTLGHRLTRV